MVELKPWLQPYNLHAPVHSLGRCRCAGPRISSWFVSVH